MFTDVDFLVAPHHGSRTKGSHLLSSLVKPRKGIVFSAPMYSNHHHPTFSAVHTALVSFADNTVFGANAEHVIFVDNNEGLTLNQIIEKIAGTDTRILICYAFSDKHLDVKAKLPRSFPNFYPKAPKYCLLATKRPVYITGVSGNIACNYNSCQPQPIFATQELMDANSLDMSAGNLKFFVQKASYDPEDPGYVYTRFSLEKLNDIYAEQLRVIEEVRQKQAHEALSKPSPLVSGSTRSSRSKSKMNENAGLVVDWDNLFGVWRREAARLIII